MAAVIPIIMDSLEFHTQSLFIINILDLFRRHDTVSVEKKKISLLSLMTQNEPEMFDYVFHI